MDESMATRDESQGGRKKPSYFVSLVRSQIVAIIASAVDFGVMIGLKEIFNQWYLLGVICGAIAGGITGFLLGRYWAFVSMTPNVGRQMMRYFLVMLGSILLNVGGVFMMVEYFDTQYIISKALVALVVGLGFNFVLHKHFVFK